MTNVAFLDLTPFFGGGQKFLINAQPHLSDRNSYHYLVRDASTYKALKGDHKVFIDSSNWISQLRFIREFVRENKIEILILNGNRPIYFSLFISSCTKIAYKHTSNNAFTGLKRLFGGVIMNFCYLFCDKVVVLYTNAIKEVIWQRWKVHVINNGVDYPFRKKETYSSEVFKVVCASRLDVDKGVRWLIQVFHKYFSNDAGIKLYIAGNGILHEELQQYVLSNGIKNIELLGFVVDTTSLLIDCDLLVLPSKFESFPLSILEAMALGLPVVATNTGGTPEMIDPGVNGFLLKYGDSQELQQAINCLYRDPQLRIRMGQHSRALFEKKFTLKNSVNKMERIYGK